MSRRFATLRAAVESVRPHVIKTNSPKVPERQGRISQPWHAKGHPLNAEEKKFRIVAQGGSWCADYLMFKGDDMATRPNTTEQAPDPNEKLVKVFDSEQESEAMIVKGLLDSAGIESDLKSGTWVQDTFPGLGGMIILVREEDAGRARQVIAESQSASPVDVNETGDDDDATAELPVAE
jgi:Putative prokaryotic signal transducing protein